MKKSILLVAAIAIMPFLFSGCEEEPKKGCTDSAALNFDSEAEEDDGTCDYQLTSCFTYSNPFPIENQSIQFAAGCSKKAVAYNWNFGDGSGEVQGAIVSHTFTAAGTYTIRLTVSDNINFHFTEQTITVGAQFARVTVNRLTLMNFPGFDSSGNYWDHPQWDPNPGPNFTLPEVYFEIENSAGTVIFSNPGDVQSVSISGFIQPDDMTDLTWNFSHLINNLDDTYRVYFFDVDPGSEPSVWEMNYSDGFSFRNQSLFGNYPSEVTLQRSVNGGVIRFSLGLTWSD